MIDGFGLQETPDDPRDYRLGAITFLPDLGELPKRFEIGLPVKNQGGTDFCSAYMSCSMSEPQENAILEPSYSFALSKEISGDIEAWGQNIRDALKAHVKVGAIEERESPYSVETKDKGFLRDIKNWPPLKDKAGKHRKQSFFKITGQYDAFDNARAALYKFEAPIGTGVQWGWSLNTTRLDTMPQGGFGHAVTIVGFTEDTLIVHNSYGKEAGKDGRHYITRDIYSHFADRYGQYMFVDIPPKTAKFNQENGIMLEDNWIIQLWKIFLNLFK